MSLFVLIKKGIFRKKASEAVSTNISLRVSALMNHFSNLFDLKLEDVNTCSYTIKRPNFREIDRAIELKVKVRPEG